MGSWGPSRGRIVGAPECMHKLSSIVRYVLQLSPSITTQSFVKDTNCQKKTRVHEFFFAIDQKGIGCSLLCRLQRGPKRLTCL
ncbi:unnamed protein product [Prunus brigantina]